jgi:hypothetical protein
MTLFCLVGSEMNHFEVSLFLISKKTWYTFAIHHVICRCFFLISKINRHLYSNTHIQSVSVLTVGVRWKELRQLAAITVDQLHRRGVDGNGAEGAVGSTPCIHL